MLTKKLLKCKRFKEEGSIESNKTDGNNPKKKMQTIKGKVTENSLLERLLKTKTENGNKKEILLYSQKA